MKTKRPGQMQGNDQSSETDFSGLEWLHWLDRAEKIVGEDGYCKPLGSDHAALFLESKSSLLVTFETFDRLETLSTRAHPFGWSMFEELGCSHLCMLSKGNTWFRDPLVYGFFDQLIDEGFFDRFEQVFFYGAAACGYAAAAYSVAAPGAQVLILRPQATLDPRVSEWDDRFVQMRRTSFNDRYGYAPDMVVAAANVVLLYDPTNKLDAMHSALFASPNILRFRTRHFGYDLEEQLANMGIIPRILSQLSEGMLTTLSLSRLWRGRRDQKGYLLNLLRQLVAQQRDYLTVLHCRSVLAAKKGGPRFRKALKVAETRLARRGMIEPDHHP